MKRHHKFMVIGFVLVGWFSTLGVRLLKNSSFIGDELYNTFYTSSYNLFGFVFILFCLLLVRDVFWYGIYGSLRLLGKDAWHLNPKNISVLGRANLIVFLLSIVMALYAYNEGKKLPEVKEITIESAKASHDMRIIHLSDLHLNRAVSAERVKALVDKVNSLSADVILITGDVIDDDATKMEKQLDALAGLNAPYGVYVSLGNHEYYSGLSSVSYRFRKMGFPLLVNRGTRLSGTNVYVAGIPDAFTANVHPTFNINMPQAMQGSDATDYRILMAHTPDIAKQLNGTMVELMLSGHTHGGQIFPFHYFVKKANKFLGGEYDVNGMKLHVSRGAGTWGPMMRLFAPSDITIINLIKNF